MSYPAKDIMASDRDELIGMVLHLQEKLEKQGAKLRLARGKLALVKSRMQKMKDTVQHQRQRIIELYPKVTATSEHASQIRRVAN
jgi:hypothetical protein